MFKSIDDYQKQYFDTVFKAQPFDYGYYSESSDVEFINGNSIIIEKNDQFLIYSIMLLLNQVTTIKRIQLPFNMSEIPVSGELIALVKYKSRGIETINDVEYIQVTKNNFTLFLDVSSILQNQEYGDLYKSNFNNSYFEQNNYLFYMIKYQGNIVGEFMYIPSLKSIESIMILEKYRKQGIGSSVLEQFSKYENTEIFLSADDSSIGFYEKINAEIIDEKSVINLYGNSRNLIGYLSMINF